MPIPGNCLRDNSFMSYRDYRSLAVKDVTEEELLNELISRHLLQQGPIKKQFHTPHHEVIIGIGNDDVAYLQLDVESFQVLKKRILKSNPGMK